MCSLSGYFLPQKKFLRKQLEFPQQRKQAPHGCLGGIPGAAGYSCGQLGMYMLMISKGHPFSEFICLYWSYSQSIPLRIHNFASISWSFLYHGPWHMEGCEGYCLSIVIIRSQTAQAVSSLKGILISVISGSFLKGLWFYPHFNFIKTVTS